MAHRTSPQDDDTVGAARCHALAIPRAIIILPDRPPGNRRRAWWHREGGPVTGEDHS